MSEKEYVAVAVAVVDLDVVALIVVEIAGINDD